MSRGNDFKGEIIMQTHALSWSGLLASSAANQKKGHPFLTALGQTECGSLTLIAPDGKVSQFSGPREGPSAHLRLCDWRALDALMARGETGFAEAYIHGLWESADLADLLTFGLMNAPALENFFHGNPWQALLARMRGLLQANSRFGSRRNVMAHYDLGNDFYRLWLDEGMTYSCALFASHPERSLEDAQQAKYQRILSRLDARPGAHILEIGCGWGGFAETAARQGLHVTGLTLSKEQAQYATERFYRAGLQHLASAWLLDYRDISGTFDHVVSIGMFEHVGERYWPIYFKTIKQRLNRGGKALVQSITLDKDVFETWHNHRGFIEEVMFPGGMLPSVPRFLAATTQAGLECRDIFTFGQDYVRTLQHWLSRFEMRKQEVSALGYDERFLRLWRFYLSACIASFASGRSDVMQAELCHAA